MVTRITRSWWMFALRGGIAVVFGVVALALPDITLEVLVTLFGALALADGIFAFATAMTDGIGGYGVWMFLVGMTEIAAGITALVWPGITELELLYVIAVSAVISGIFEILAGINLRKLTQGAEWLILSGAFSVAVGVALALPPAASALAHLLLIGISAILFGYLLLVLAFSLREAGVHMKRLTDGD